MLQTLSDPLEPPPGPPSDICACVCTHNGQAVLPDCLDSLASQDLPASRFSILVVDDGSTDDTAALVRRWRSCHPNLAVRLACQPALGLSVARNTGLHLADAPLIAYIDDDAVAEPTWLSALATAFAEFPAAGAVGGPVSVRWISDKPRWWRDELDEVFNRFHAGHQPCTLRFPRLPYGCNVAFRRDLALALGMFRTDLGRQKGTLLGGEETELLLRILAAGHDVAYWPSARVQHLAVPHRVTRRYALRRAWMHGRGLARLARDYPAVAQSIPSLGACLYRMFATARQHGFRLAHWKYWLLRLGYHREHFSALTPAGPAHPQEQGPRQPAASPHQIPRKVISHG